MSSIGICRECGTEAELSIKGYCRACFTLGENRWRYEKRQKRICRICKNLEFISADGACERCYQRLYRRQYRAKQRERLK